MAVSTLSGCKCSRLRKFVLRCALIASSAVGLSHSSATAQELSSQWQMTNTNVSVDPAQQRQTMRMVINTSREVTASENFVRVRVQNPSVLSALPLAPNRLQISAAATGVTQIDLLGEDDSVHSIEVMVLGDVRELEAILRELFPDANLQVYPIQSGCIVSGFVTSDEHVDQVARIAELYFPTVINKVRVTGIFTIQLEVQIMEVSRTKLRELGVDWAFSNGDDFISQTVNGLITANGTAFSGTGQETFTLGVIDDSFSFFAGIRALRRNNLVKVLAEPKLVAVDGRPASFNSGGEIPIIVPAGLGQVAVQFREFGTRLDYVAKVRGNGRIWLEVRPYVSEVDPSRSVNIEGINVPGFRSRFLETGVELGAGQTLALGGLLQVKTEVVNSGLPFLSDMPYLGALFRSTKEEQNEVELLITVTPNFAGPLDPHEVPCTPPGLSSDSPTDNEFFFRGYMETPVVGGENCTTCWPDQAGVSANPYSVSPIENYQQQPVGGNMGYPGSYGAEPLQVPQELIPTPSATQVQPTPGQAWPASQSRPQPNASQGNYPQAAPTHQSTLIQDYRSAPVHR